MFKNFLKRCILILNRSDLLDAVENYNHLIDIEDTQIRNDLLRLISFYNFTMEATAEHYFDFITTELITSNIDSQIPYYTLVNRAIKILDVKNPLNKKVNFDLTPNYIIVEAPYREYLVTYKYIPKVIKDISDDMLLPKNISKKIIAYGVVSEFFASKNEFEASEFWKNKFLYEIFKYKTKKERLLKSTFIR
ncbi:MAG: hypothetical protein IJ538_02175 [Clostridia bacterium]|nr:hypothetical protein [Clostridia bacterium]